MKKSILICLILGVSSLFAFSQPFATQSQWETYFKNRIQNLDPIEGIWHRSAIRTTFNWSDDFVRDNHTAEIAIYKSGNVYKTYCTDKDNAPFIRTFRNSATAGIYLFEIYYPESYSTAKASVVLSGNALIKFSYQKTDEQLRREMNPYLRGDRQFFEESWIKLSPIAEDNVKKQKSSGTGFAISSNGIIVTNFHVIDGAKSILIRGINADFNKTYKAKILLSDKNNDLALLQIDDYGFTSFGTIPYTFKMGLGSVGENIFVLGYPLRASMGDEVKLTNGIISSRTGFQGDITSYQVSAPAQPGNSGGPLFDNQGNLIGIISAKHAGAENVSYAVKSTYLINLIDLLSNPLKLQTVNLLTGKSLTQQVELVKKFVYIIEVE